MNLALGKAKDVQTLKRFRVVAYKSSLINKDGGASGATVTREDIASLPVRSAAGVAGTVGGVNSMKDLVTLVSVVLVQMQLTSILMVLKYVGLQASEICN